MHHDKLLPVTVIAVLLSCGAAAPGVLAEDEVDEAIDDMAAFHNEVVEDEDFKVVCEKEARIGTRIKETVCRTVARKKQDRQDGQEFMRRMRTNSVCTRPEC